jgi:hypothetical protein
MKSQHPPAAATWLLEHLARGPRKEALIGDLQEEFYRGRTAAWYWRQALLAASMEIIRMTSAVWTAAAAALLWGTAMFWFPLYVRDVTRTAAFNAVLEWGMRLAFPFSMIYGIAVFNLMSTLLLIAALTVYLAAAGGLHPRKVLIGMISGWIVMEVSSFGWAILPSPLHFPAGASFRSAVVSVPLFFGVLAAIWAARRLGPRGEPAKATV